MQLIDRLQTLAALWSSARGLSLSRLGSIVIRDGRFFERVAGGASCTVATFEKFIAYFRDSANWPDGVVIGDAAVILNEMPVHVGFSNADISAPSSGKSNDVTGQVAA